MKGKTRLFTEVAARFAALNRDMPIGIFVAADNCLKNFPGHAGPCLNTRARRCML